MTTNELGNIYLAFWNLDVKDPPHVNAVRDCLSANNLSRDRAADVPAVTALRRAVDALKSKTIEAKTFTCKASGLSRAQIDEVTEDEGRLRRRFIGQYELSKDGQPRHISGDDLADFWPAFEQASAHYTGADISKVIQAILTEDGLGAFSPRKGAGVYFVPVKPEAADLLERISRFAEAVSVRFLTYSVPDTSAQRTEIANAIAASYLAEIALHAEYVAGYDVDTKGGIIANRREALEATASAMNRLQGLMNGRYAEMTSEIDGLRVKLDTLVSERAASLAIAQQAHQLSGGRRIVTSGV
jgi:hypothetical protein